MADLRQLIQNKKEQDDQRKADWQAKRDEAAALRDATIAHITTDPEAYIKYLKLQGDNLSMSVGNIALVLCHKPEATNVAMLDRWKSLGRTVKAAELANGVKIFTRAPKPRKGYVLASVYDVSQTTGKAIREIRLVDDSAQMEKALSGLMSWSPVQVSINEKLGQAAYYDAEKQKLVMAPDYTDSEVFARLAAEVVQARLHDMGRNTYYHREGCQLDAESVAFLLCRRFHVACPEPDTAQLARLYEGFEVTERTDALSNLRDLADRMARSIERDLEMEQRNRIQTDRPSH